MTKRLNVRASLIGLVVSTMLSMPSLAVAQMSGGMGHNSMMPMGKGQMEGEMPMPAKMPPKKPGCCGMKGGMAAKSATMPSKSAKPHSHRRAKAKPTAARRAPAATAKPAVAAKPATAKPAPMKMPM